MTAGMERPDVRVLTAMKERAVIRTATDPESFFACPARVLMNARPVPMTRGMKTELAAPVMTAVNAPCVTVAMIRAICAKAAANALPVTVSTRKMTGCASTDISTRTILIPLASLEASLRGTVHLGRILQDLSVPAVTVPNAAVTDGGAPDAMGAVIVPCWNVCSARSLVPSAAVQKAVTFAGFGRIRISIVLPVVTPGIAGNVMARDI